MLISFHLIKNLTTNIYNEHANGAEDLVQIRWRTFTKLLELKLSPLLRYICVSELSQPAACSLPSHYLNQFCFIANWTLRNKFDINMKRCIFAHSGVISLVYLFVCMYISYKAHNRCTQETFLKGSDFDVNMFCELRSVHSVTMKSIWEVVFWTVTYCDSHQLRHYRRNWWFVAICDQGRDGTNWVQ